MTKEQRALDIITDNELLRKNTPKVRGAIRDALIQIATEQKAEDIDKACKWLKCDGLTSDFIPCELTVFDVQEFIEAFRKAMEEEQ